MHFTQPGRQAHECFKRWRCQEAQTRGAEPQGSTAGLLEMSLGKGRDGKRNEYGEHRLPVEGQRDGNLWWLTQESTTCLDSL